MLKRNRESRQEESESTQVDAAEEREEPLFGGAAVDNHAGDEPHENYDFASDEGDFPSPHTFNVEDGGRPVIRTGANSGVDALPTDEDGAFKPQGDEFLDDAEEFVDDRQRDYYEYGDKMHGVREFANPEPAVGAVAAVASTTTDGKAKTQSDGATRGKHRKPTKKEIEDAMPEYHKRSKRTRRILILVVFLLIILLGGLAYWGYQIVQSGRDMAVQQANQTGTDTSQVSGAKGTTDDNNGENSKTTDVPVLTALIGLTQEQVVEQLGHGATITLSTPITDEADAPIGANVTVMLTGEPADAKSGTPTVYLTLDADGLTTQAGYSAATVSLGYGSLSFIDAVTNEHVVEKTLNDAGLVVENGTVALPSKAEYSTYASDGVTLVSEKCTFDGTSNVDGVDYNWSSVLSYDYTAANASGNLTDTVRQISVYVTRA